MNFEFIIFVSMNPNVWRKLQCTIQIYKAKSALLKCRFTKIKKITYSNATVVVSSEQFGQNKNYCVDLLICNETICFLQSRAFLG